MGKSSFFKTMQVDQDSGELGVLSDQWVTLGRPSNEKVVPLVKARLIEFYDSSQDRCALTCDLLVKVVMKQLSRLKSVKWSYANLAAMIKHHLMTYINLIEFLKNQEKAMLQYKRPQPQLQLWGP